MEQAVWPDKGLEVRELQAELTAIRCGVEQASQIYTPPRARARRARCESLRP